MTDPTTDCPACPKCALPTGTTEGRDCATLPSPRLRCAACGNVWEASVEDREKAERADAAHEARRRAEEAAGVWEPSNTSAPPFDLDAMDALARSNAASPWSEDSAADVLRLAARVRDLTAKLDATAQALDDLVGQVWRASGETHEPPTDVAALLRRVAWTRERLVAEREGNATLRKAVIAMTVSEADAVAKASGRVAAARREGAEAMREACVARCEAVALLHSPTARAVYAESVARALRTLPLPGGDP